MALLALIASGSIARAAAFGFTYTGTLVNFTVPATDTFQILAFGAQGGSGTFAGFVGAGGLGAEIGGDFSLTAGEVLQIAVGGQGASNPLGGGGTFVIGSAPLVIAGGGGGGGSVAGAAQGQGGLIGQDGGGSPFNGVPTGGTSGNGGPNFDGALPIGVVKR